MLQCKICKQILGGTELHCDRKECPNRGWHAANEYIWKTVLNSDGIIHDHKQIRVKIETCNSRLRVTVSINAFIILQTEIEDMTSPINTIYKDIT